MSAVGDRIEDDTYAVLLTEDARELVVPISEIPIEVEGGMWIRFDEKNGQLVNVEHDHDKQTEMRSRVSEKMDRLRRRGRNTQSEQRK